MGNTSQINRKKMAPLPKRNHRRRIRITTREQKAVAKIGLAGSLGALFVSGFLKFHGAKSLHLYSGFGLLAFTVWHHLLNQPKATPKRR